MVFFFSLESFVGRLWNKSLIYFVDQDNMLLLNFCLRSIFMNLLQNYK